MPSAMRHDYLPVSIDEQGLAETYGLPVAVKRCVEPAWVPADSEAGMGFTSTVGTAFLPMENDMMDLSSRRDDSRLLIAKWFAA